MHHHLQNLMMQKLGSDARNVIAAERSRQTSVIRPRQEEEIKERDDAGYIAKHLSEVGEISGADELALLNEYRERYAGIMGELLVAKDRLLKLEIDLKDRSPNELLRRRLSEDIDELNDLNEVDYNKRQWKRRSSEW